MARIPSDRGSAPPGRSRPPRASPSEAAASLLWELTISKSHDDTLTAARRVTGIPSAACLSRSLAGSLDGTVLAFCAATAILCSPVWAADRRLVVRTPAVEATISGRLPVPEPDLVQWIDDAAAAVTTYLGRYPVPRVRLRIRAGGSGGIGRGMTFGGGAPQVRVDVGRDTKLADLRSDWVLTHEMFHLAFPDLTSDDTWAEEGLSTYIEPLGRARIGTISADKVWADLIEGIPQGARPVRARGLHGTGDWGRTYWGGALFWLLADVGIREKTHGRHGLPDALVGILEAGGDIRAHWDLRRTLAAADRAVGVSLLSDLYDRLAARPGTVDLDDLWRRLGVRRAIAGPGSGKDAD